MIRNQKGDALTLAMGAAVFIGISIMVVIAILGNMDSQVKKARLVNDVEATVLYINQILNNKDLCTYALRTAAGTAVLFNGLPAPAPPIVPRTTIPIPRIYMTNALGVGAVPPANHLAACLGLPDADGDGAVENNPACPTPNHVAIRSINFEFRNDLNNHKAIYYKGSSTRYWLLSGELAIDFDFPRQIVVGGDLKTKRFPFNVLYDSVGDVPNGIAPGQVEMCYTKESPSLLCTQLGGSLNPLTGVCEQMFGECGVPPNRPTNCGVLGAGYNCATTAGLVWTVVYYAATVMPGMQMACTCMSVCSTP